MNHDRWRRIEDLYHAALERDASMRPAFLAEACADDAAVRHEVELLLAQAASAEGFLNEPAAALLTARGLTADLVGRQLGTHRITGRLGAGGMGEVFRARDTRLGRDVAIKVLAPVFAADPDCRARFRREAQALAALNHPHICTVHEIGDAGDRLFIVMEHIDGRSLSDVVGDGLPAVTAIRYGAQIAAALAHAHERGVVHRDLKSANLMVASDGRVKVLDFGVATLAGDAAALATTRAPTAQGSLMGTLAYMAPERLKGALADQRSDIWSLGVVVYEMVASRRPFGGDTSFEISSAILRDEPLGLPRHVPPPLRMVITRCLAKDPALRYQQAGEVRATLEAMATPTTTEEPEPTPPRVNRASKARGPAKARIRSIAVLPLDNLSRDPEQEYFADGITEALIGAVAQIEGLRVISRMSIMRFKGATKSVPEIARDLNVEGIIAGSVHRVGDRVRISTQLLDAARDAHLWSANYDRDLRDIFALETEIGQAVATEIALKVRSPHTRRASTARKIAPEAYVLYLRGRHLARQIGDANLRQAKDCFEQVIAREPGYAPAYASLAHVYHWMRFGEWMEPRAAYEPGGRAAAKAVELEPDLAEAHAALGTVKFNFDWDWGGAERTLRRAIEIDPNAAEARAYYAGAIGNVGRLEEAVTHETIARDLDPLWPVPHLGLGYWTFLLGRYDESAAHHEAALQLDPNFPLAHVAAGMVALKRGRNEEALEHFRRAVTTVGAMSFPTGCLAYGCAMTGQRDEAERLVQEFEARGKSRYVSFAPLCWPYIALNRVDDALRCLRIAYEQRDPFLVCLPDFPWWDPIRGTDTFREIFDRMKFPLPRRQALLATKQFGDARF